MGNTPLFLSMTMPSSAAVRAIDFISSVVSGEPNSPLLAPCAVAATTRFITFENALLTLLLIIYLLLLLYYFRFIARISAFSCGVTRYDSVIF